LAKTNSKFLKLGFGAGQLLRALGVLCVLGEKNRAARKRQFTTRRTSREAAVIMRNLTPSASIGKIKGISQDG